MFSKKKKKPQISLPSNFEHRVHTGFDKKEGRYIGLPLQWASIVGNNQVLKSSNNRPMPVSEIYPESNFRICNNSYHIPARRPLSHYAHITARLEDNCASAEQPRHLNR